MLASRLGLGVPTDPISQFAFLAIAGLTMYFLLSGASYLIFFVWGRRRFHPDYVPDAVANRRAIRLAIAGTVGNVILMMPLHWLIAHGHSRIYWDVSQHGLAWLGVSFLLYLAFTETCIYWIHRGLHARGPYRRLHHRHHEWEDTTSWVSMAFHPLDSFAQALPHHVIGFLIPIHGWMYLTMVSFVSVWAVMIHDRVSFIRWGAINYTAHHTLHHRHYECNYGQFFTWWDRAMGTYRSPSPSRS